MALWNLFDEFVPWFVSDLLVGWFIHKILKQRNVPEKICTYSVMVWLFNPFTFTIGTRGNCEPLVCAMILWIVISLMKGTQTFFEISTSQWSFFLCRVLFKFVAFML